MTDNTWILKEMTVNELFECRDEHTARLEDACKHSPISYDAAHDAALSIKAIENELIERGAL